MFHFFYFFLVRVRVRVTVRVSVRVRVRVRSGIFPAGQNFIYFNQNQEMIVTKKMMNSIL